MSKSQAVQVVLYSEMIDDFARERGGIPFSPTSSGFCEQLMDGQSGEKGFQQEETRSIDLSVEREDDLGGGKKTPCCSLYGHCRR